MQTDLHKRIGCGKQAPTPFGFELYVLRFGDVSVVLHIGGARGGMTARRHAQWLTTANIISGFCVAAASFYWFCEKNEECTRKLECNV